VVHLAITHRPGHVILPDANTVRVVQADAFQRMNSRPTGNALIDALQTSLRPSAFPARAGFRMPVRAVQL
jgi:hypothetical protein